MSSPLPGSTAAAVDALLLQVNRDTVLKARAGLLAEAHRLRQVLRDNNIHDPIGLCGGDPVSQDAQRAFNERIADLVVAAQQHVDELFAGADKLGASARSYGLTDDEISASFTVGR